MQDSIKIIKTSICRRYFRENSSNKFFFETNKTEAVNMANMLKKEEITRVLVRAGIDFNPEETLVELRRLFDEVIDKLLTDASDNANESLIDLGGDDEPHNSSQQQQQQQSGSGGTHSNAHGPAAMASTGRRQQQQQTDLDREIAIARKRIELTLLQQQQMQVEKRRFDFSVFDSMTNKFSGDDAYDIKKWFKDLEHAFAMFICTDGDKLMAAKRAVSGTAQTFLRSKQVLTYIDLKQLMIHEFEQSLTAREVYQQLQNRKKNQKNH